MLYDVDGNPTTLQINDAILWCEERGYIRVVRYPYAMTDLITHNGTDIYLAAPFIRSRSDLTHFLLILIKFLDFPAGIKIKMVEGSSRPSYQILLREESEKAA